MFDKLKYIAYDTGLSDTMLLFPEVDKHADIASRMGLRKDQILGAGFVVFPEGVPECFGESISLEVKSREEDTKLLHFYLSIKPKD